MHPLAKIALLIGGLMTIGGIAWAGIGTFSLASSIGEIIDPTSFNAWNGTAPASEEFSSDHDAHTVWIENETGDVTFHLWDNNGVDLFEECSSVYEECGYAELNGNGYTEIGSFDLYEGTGPFTIEVEGNGTVHVVDLGELEEQAMSLLDDVKELGAGALLCCCGIVILAAGVLMALTMNEPNAPQVVYQPSVSQQVGTDTSLYQPPPTM